MHHYSLPGCGKLTSVSHSRQNNFITKIERGFPDPRESVPKLGFYITRGKSRIHGDLFNGAYAARHCDHRQYNQIEMSHLLRILCRTNLWDLVQKPY